MARVITYDRDNHLLRVQHGGATTNLQLPLEAIKTTLWHFAGHHGLSTSEPKSEKGAAAPAGPARKVAEVEWDGTGRVAVDGEVIYQAKPWHEAAAYPPSIDSVRYVEETDRAGSAGVASTVPIGVVGPKMVDILPDGTHVPVTGADVPAPVTDDPTAAAAKADETETKKAEKK